MKTKQCITALCILALLMSTMAPAFASDGGDTTSYVVDVAVARPVSLAMTIVGAKLGPVVGRIVGRRAELLGGLILIGIGVKILIEHLSA